MIADQKFPENGIVSIIICIHDPPIHLYNLLTNFPQSFELSVHRASKYPDENVDIVRVVLINETQDEDDNVPDRITRPDIPTGVGSVKDWKIARLANLTIKDLKLKLVQVIFRRAVHEPSWTSGSAQFDKKLAELTYD